MLYYIHYTIHYTIVYHTILYYTLRPAPGRRRRADQGRDAEYPPADGRQLVYIYIYIYRERERDIMYTHTYI